MIDYIEKFKALGFAERVAILIGIPCITISTIQTAVGWNYTTGLLLLSVTLSFIASGMMFALDLQMNHYKARGKFLRIAVILLFYMVFTAFSFVGNFNALYTETIKDELFTKELQKARDYTRTFENGYNELIDAEKDSIKNNVQRLLQELRAEILTGTKGLLGCGPNCIDIINEFENYGIAKPMIPADFLTAQKQADQLTNEINGNLQFRLLKYDEDNAAIKEALKNNLDSANVIFNNTDDIGFFENKKEVLEKTFKMTSRMYKDMVAQLEGYLGLQLDSEFPEITFNPGDVGKWSFALNHAKKDLNNNSLTILVIILLCLLIDLVVPLVIIFFVPIDTDLVIEDETKDRGKRQNLIRHQEKMNRNLDRETWIREDWEEQEESTEIEPDPAFIKKWRSR
ncbi:hypothetical protein QQ020_21655 [Fulvivirgaceae bacterium BMA12]|uniref:DUF4407 domain-containing protein n=1 Tax=Agaribacillus aureus TaxID=3051825 RepID=A0ABT8LAD2_9BACT|nr:hypothetical protein [Fulvivirgaceae bacterium BMA12]